MAADFMVTSTTKLNIIPLNSFGAFFARFSRASLKLRSAGAALWTTSLSEWCRALLRTSFQLAA